MTLTQQFKETWLKENQSLLHRIASRFRYLPAFEYTELLQIINMLAWEALGKFDSEKGTKSGCKLSTYVYTHVRGYLQLEYAKYSRGYRISWSDLSTAPLDLSLEQDNENDSIVHGSVKLKSDFDETNLDFKEIKTKIKNILSLLEYEVLLSEFDIDTLHNFVYNNVVEIVKPTLMPIIRRKLKTKLADL